MPKLRITGPSPLAGEYDFDPTRIKNTRIAHVIKRETGLRGGELDDAIAKLDGDVLTAMVYIPLKDNHKLQGDNWDPIWELDYDQIEIDVSDLSDEGDALPPAGPPNDGGSGSDGDASSSGDSSSPGSENLVQFPSPTGDPGSDPSAA